MELHVKDSKVHWLKTYFLLFQVTRFYLQKNENCVKTLTGRIIPGVG